MSDNVIICAATRYECMDSDELYSFVICSPRHYDQVHRQTAAFIDDWVMECVIKEEQGFVDRFGVFHDRYQALKIAQAADQLIRKTPPEDKLFSEDLY